MGIDFKDCITFNHKDGGRIAIPRKSILSVRTKKERDYSATPTADVEVTQLFIELATAELLGFNMNHVHHKDIGVYVPITDKYELVLGILRGDKAIEVLF